MIMKKIAVSGEKKIPMDIGRKTTSLYIFHSTAVHFKLHCNAMQIPSQGIFYIV